MKNQRVKFKGYRRDDGTVGVRNHIIVLPSVVCASEVANAIARRVEGVVPIIHQHGCSQVGDDAKQTRRVLVGLGRNPNVAAVIVIGLGCETISGQEVAEGIAKSKKPVELLVMQEVGGTIRAVEEGAEIARNLVSYANGLKREEVDLGSIILGTECGGSDACSGLSANPSVGFASDLMVEAGGTVILSETTEMIGAEHLLAKRAIGDEVARRIIEIVDRVEERSRRIGVDIRGANPVPGNIRGGITTLEEKSLGCMAKGGTGRINEVLEYGERPTKRGLVIMDTPGHDAESVTGMIAGGAQMVVFTTGRGSPLGSPVTPVIKVASNSGVFRLMEDNMDINAGTVMDGNETVQEVGRRIFNEIIEVASGKLTKSELLGHMEIAINRIAPTF